MTAVVIITCDLSVVSGCKQSERCMLGDWPPGWWEVPGIGKDPDKPGHACPPCALASIELIAEKRSQDLRRLMGYGPAEDAGTTAALHPAAGEPEPT